ncbi:MAG: sialidase family protein [Candidatus Thorarchaeota archaeon]
MKTRILVIIVLLMLFTSYPSDGIIQSDDFLITSFSKNILLSTSDTPYTHHVEPTITIDDNNVIYVGWKNAFSHNGPGVRVSFSKSTNNGKTWSTPFDLPMFEGNTGQSDPWLVWQNQILFYAYLEYSINTNELSQITVARSINQGDTWNLVAASNAEGFADKETMTISNDGTIYVAYDDLNYDTNITTVRLTRSSDYGDSFDEVGIIADSTTHPGDHLGPYVVTDSKNDVYVAWVWFSNGDWGDVYLETSQNRGETFSEEIDINPLSENATMEISPDQRPSRSTLPVIRFDQNDRLYILWADRHTEEGEWDIFIRYSDDYGQTWSDRYQVNPKSTGNQWQPEMDIDSKNRCHIVWYDEHEDTYGPYYRTLTFPEDDEEEIIFGDPINIATKNTSSIFTRPGDYFSIKVDSNDIPHIVWSDGRENEMDIYYSHGIAETASSVGFTTTSTSSSSPLHSISFGFLVPIMLFFSNKWRKNRRKRN